MTEEPPAERPSLTLFISGASFASTEAVRRLRDLCEEYYPGGYDLEIVDVHQQPALVTSRSVVAVPTLIQDLPHPMRLLVGDFTDTDRVLTALGLVKEPADRTTPDG